MSASGLFLICWFSFLAGWAIGLVVFDDSVPRRLSDSERHRVEQAAQEFSGLGSWYALKDEAKEVA